jgi:hypothetical protein
MANLLEQEAERLKRIYGVRYHTHIENNLDSLSHDLAAAPGSVALEQGIMFLSRGLPSPTPNTRRRCYVRRIKRSERRGRKLETELIKATWPQFSVPFKMSDTIETSVAVEQLKCIRESWKELGRTKLKTPEYQTLLNKIRVLSAEYQVLVNAREKPDAQDKSLPELRTDA